MPKHGITSRVCYDMITICMHARSYSIPNLPPQRSLLKRCPGTGSLPGSCVSCGYLDTVSNLDSR